jgi:hypothetical protein
MNSRRVPLTLGHRKNTRRLSISLRAILRLETSFKAPVASERYDGAGQEAENAVE